MAAFLVLFSRSLPQIPTIHLQLHFPKIVDAKQEKQDVKQEISTPTQSQPVLKNEPISISKRAFVDTVPFIKQLPELERGCEVTSLAMLIQSSGVSVDKMTLANEIPKVPFHQGNHYGNPSEGFVGDIYSHTKAGLGVYHGPLFQLAKKYLPRPAIDLTGQDIKKIYNMLDQGVPVLVITNTTFSPLNDNQFETWDTSSGTIKITYYEHSVVIVGYDEQNVYINDPLADSPRTIVPRQSFEQAWVQMGSQAISYEPI